LLLALIGGGASRSIDLSLNNSPHFKIAATPRWHTVEVRYELTDYVIDRGQCLFGGHKAMRLNFNPLLDCFSPSEAKPIVSGV
jgi:hypothetical protein